MKKEKLKIDLRNAEKEDLIMLTRILMSLSHLFSQNGCKVHLKRQQSSKVASNCRTEQKNS